MAGKLNNAVSFLRNYFTVPEDDIIDNRVKNEFIIGAKNELKESASVAQSQIMDVASDIYIYRNPKYEEDKAQSLNEMIKRLRNNQMVVVDFSEVENNLKSRVFDVLLGAVMAVDGYYKVLDINNENLVLFSNGTRQIADEAMI